MRNVTISNVLPSVITIICIYGGFLKWEYSQIIHLNRIVYHKSSILGCPHLWKPQNKWCNTKNGRFPSVKCIDTLWKLMVLYIVGPLWNPPYILPSVMSSGVAWTPSLLLCCVRSLQRRPHCRTRFSRRRCGLTLPWRVYACFNGYCICRLYIYIMI